MTAKQAMEILTLLTSNFADTAKNDSDQMRDARAKLWIAGLSDIDYDVAKSVITAYVLSTEDRFMPTVGVVRAKIIEAMQHAPQLSEGEAWAMVRAALGNSYYNGAAEFALLPSVVQRAVGSASTLKDWGLMDADSLSVAQSQFLRAFRAEQKREHDEKLVPLPLRNKMQQLRGAVNVSDIMPSLAAGLTDEN